MPTTQAAALQVITDGVNRTVTPQQLVSDLTPDFTTTIGTPTVEITDPNITEGGSAKVYRVVSVDRVAMDKGFNAKCVSASGGV